MTSTAPQPLVVVGPTASGKSSVALEVARRRRASGRPTEIISCDSMAVYRGMDIGTATASAAVTAEVPHHLLDVVDPGVEYSVHAFTEQARSALADLRGRSVDAVLVGGTGLYVRAVTDGLAPPPRYPEIAAELEGEPDTTVLLSRLEELDPLAASRIPTGNRRRIVRALEVTLGSGRPFSAAGPGLDVYPPTPFVIVGLDVPRDVLAARIRARYVAQLDAGFLDEVRALASREPGPSRTAREALGYRELLAHLRGEVDLDTAIETAVIRTRRFAVRQERWFRRDPRVTWFDATSVDAATLAERIDAHWSVEASAPATAADSPRGTVSPDALDRDPDPGN